MVRTVALGFLLALAAPSQGSVQDPDYLLPYPLGDSARLIQGPGGPWGHQGAAEFSYDFILPIGSSVVAARDGQVVAVEGRYSDGTREPGEENYIFVSHGDSTYGRYYHLTKSGPRVVKDQRVRAGDVIGLSGNSGASAGPHLHFDVTRGCPEWGCQTIPIRFRNAGADSLEAGKTYRALTP